MSDTSDIQWLSYFQSAYVIALGITVVLTLLVSIYASRVTRRMQAGIADANRDAAEARMHATEAAARAKEMESRVEALKNENFDLQIQLEKERLARLEIERRLAPRFLSTNEQQKIIDTLRPHTGHGISVTLLLDHEAKAYGEQLIATFASAGWKPQVDISGIMVPPVYGVICTVSEKPTPATQAVVSALKEASVMMTVRTGRIEPDEIRILIGLKPPS